MVSQANPWVATLEQGGRKITIEVGRLGSQADGAVWVRSGREALLATGTAQKEALASQGFFPLTVEYREKMAGAGRIPGSFQRREGRAAERETLGSRLVDRSLRPHFPAAFRNETQVIATVHSFDEEGDPLVLAITAASMALHCSDIPWAGPVAGVRVIELDGAIVPFPSAADRKEARLDLVAAVSRQGLVMVEGHGREISESGVLAAIEAAREAAGPVLDFQDRMRAEIGKEKRAPIEATPASDSEARLRPIVLAGIDDVYAASGKLARREKIEDLLRTACAALAGPADAAPRLPGAPPFPAPPEIAERILNEEIRRRALDGLRLDGRRPQEIRPISSEVTLLPGAHGSALFTRGETQALVSCTLGTRQSEQLIEEPLGVHHERFILHYTFPPYSVGEVRPLRGPGRREIGHGHLARRALLAVLPDRDDFAYTVRLDAEITSSNGSSSMATVCGSSLALMDAGAPIRRPVAGIAMGLIEEGGRRVILSDILGDEDHLGDMDFKVAGTTEGVTALQLDNKVGSLAPEIL
ncbi:MAG: polyribonucleotide nucleotidyltransferase, partial [Candidatus Eisenbacteria bacterium]